MAAVRDIFSKQIAWTHTTNKKGIIFAAITNTLQPANTRYPSQTNHTATRINHLFFYWRVLHQTPHLLATGLVTLTLLAAWQPLAKRIPCNCLTHHRLESQILTRLIAITDLRVSLVQVAVIVLTLEKTSHCH